MNILQNNKKISRQHVKINQKINEYFFKQIEQNKLKSTGINTTHKAIKQ